MKGYFCIHEVNDRCVNCNPKCPNFDGVEQERETEMIGNKYSKRGCISDDRM